MNRSTAIGCCLALAGGIGIAAELSAAEVTPLESEMPPETFRAAGLDRLTKEELGELNRWLRSRVGEGSASSESDIANEAVTDRPASLPSSGREPEYTALAVTSVVAQAAVVADEGSDETPDKEFGAEQLRETQEEPDEAESITSHIVGEFSGWDGKTEFRLANGQIWRQRHPARYYHR
ncbi:MAG: hypothetical protein P8Y95_07095, partial [Gammaproteobacteria bacterium]